MTTIARAAAVSTRSRTNALKALRRFDASDDLDVTAGTALLDAARDFAADVDGHPLAGDVNAACDAVEWSDLPDPDLLCEVRNVLERLLFATLDDD